jgi:DNA-binding GntR family transcriptional regulator
MDHAAAARDWREVATTGLRFHQALVAMLGSSRLDAMFTSIAAQIRLAFAAVADQAEFQAEFVRRDRDICDMVIAGSRAAAGAALRQYLDDAERVVTDVVRLHLASIPSAGATGR